MNWTKQEHPVGWIIKSNGVEVARFIKQFCPEGEIDKLIDAHESELERVRAERDELLAAAKGYLEQTCGVYANSDARKRLVAAVRDSIRAAADFRETYPGAGAEKWLVGDATAPEREGNSFPSILESAEQARRQERNGRND
jgi:hypothetical protein